MIMRYKLQIHVWQLSGFGRLNIDFALKLRQCISDIEDISRNTGLTPFVISSILRTNKKSDSTNIKNIFRLTDFLKISRKIVEENIEYFRPQSSQEWKGTKIVFPLQVTPLWFRCVGVGDFSVTGEYCGLIWHQNSTKPMRDLIKYLIGIDSHYWVGGYSGLNERVYIPSVIRDAVCAILKISKRKITTSRFINACLNLPRLFRVQVLAQAIVDDGYCDKVHNRVSIHMKNKVIIEALYKLCQSLGYKSAIITRNTGKYESNNFYDLILTVEGTFKFYTDLKQMIKIYGNSAGLWNKQSSFEKVVEKIDLKRLERIEANKKYKKDIIRLINGGITTSGELINSLKIPRRKFFNLMSDLKNKGIVKNIKHKTYSLCK